YGIDSVMVMKMTNELEKAFGSLSKTLFFEYQTIRELTNYFLETFSDKLTDLLTPEKPEETVAPQVDRKIEVHDKTPAITPQLVESAKVSDVVALKYFRELLSKNINLPAEQIDVEKLMDEYGIDSVMVMKMTNELEEKFGSLSKTLFFEYQTIRELTDYFMETFPQELAELINPVSTPTWVAKLTSNGQASKAFTQKVLPNFAARVNPLDHLKTAGQEVKKQPASVTDGPLDIAIVGVSGSYPQARDLKTFWEVLKTGKNCVTEIPESRWDHSQFYDPDRNKWGKTNGKWGGFLDGIDEFDPRFFSISAREAEALDPQERLFLQCAYETLEDAGYTRNALGYDQSSRVGVYVGVMNEEYQLFGAQETIQGRPTVLSGNAASIANRVSYFCNFNGPSIALNTMCSSSLTTIHLACQSLILGECDAAIAGGVNVTVHPNKYMALGYGNFLSSKGLCESFGSEGDGYVPGEGVGAVMLKPLAKAIADNDHVYGVIKGTAINHGGKTNGYTVPNPKAQGNVIASALKRAAFEPNTISYVEAHGTGTSLISIGSPNEVPVPCAST
ncbi:MAG: beta-ketoacyl synthase N-terminal-like domain-containing protein, partial [Bacteroidota bacterium]